MTAHNPETTHKLVPVEQEALTLEDFRRLVVEYATAPLLARIAELESAERRRIAQDEANFDADMAARRMTRAAPAAPTQEPVAYIQRDHLEKARKAPFLCRVEPTQRLADLLPIFAAPFEPPGGEDRRDATGRSPTGYALEFAEYMAKDAEGLIVAIGNVAMQQMRLDDETEADDEERDCYEQALYEAKVGCDEAMHGLRNSVYEFRKRRDRAALGTTPSASGEKEAT